MLTAELGWEGAVPPPGRSRGSLTPHGQSDGCEPLRERGDGSLSKMTAYSVFLCGIN